jgi:hypothetical protein
MYCLGGHPILTDVVFQDNVCRSETTFAAGLCADDVTILGAVFSGNVAMDYGDPRVGGLACGGSSHLEDVVFFDNPPEAASVGGSAVLERVTFWRCGKGLSCWGSPVLRNVTFWRNQVYAILWQSQGTLELQNSIIACTRSGPAITMGYDPSTDINLSCCDLYGNAGGDWVGCIEDQLGVDGNISLNALFCGEWSEDMTLHENSPCAPFSPPNEECDLIGAWTVGCGPSPVEPVSWTSIKAKYRASPR